MTREPESAIDPKETVFIVDDDESIREGLSNFLEAVGIDEVLLNADEFLLEVDAPPPQGAYLSPPHCRKL